MGEPVTSIPLKGVFDVENLSHAARASAQASAAATPRADETTLLAATLVAQTAYELLVDPDLVAAVWRDFRGE